MAGDFEISGEISGEPDPESLRRVQTAFTEAMVKALTDPRVRAAALQIAKTIQTAMKGASKGFDAEARKMQQAAQRAARAMGQAFDQVRKKAEQAVNVPTKNASLSTLETSIASIAGRFEELAQATREQIRLLEIMTRAEQAATRARSQEATDARNLQISAQRARTADLQLAATQARAAANIQTATIRATSREAIQQSRVMIRVFELTWKSAERAVRAFARGASAILSGLVRTVQSTFRGIGRLIQTTFTGASRGLSGFARAVTAAFSAASRAIASALRRDEQAINSSLRRREQAFNSSMSRQQRASQRFQQAQQRGILSGLGGGGLLAGAAGGAGIYSLLTSGFERFGQQEQLQLTFQTLLQSGPRATAMLQTISDYARTTAFDFVEVAGSVAQLTASLGDVDQAFDLTTFLADVVALTGGTTEALGRVRLAMTQIASAGRLDSANLRQLTESLPGVPFAQILADKFFGGDVQAYAQARDAGELGAKVTAEAFFDAFEEGVTTRFPEVEGFAQTAATTVTGLAANLKENFAIFGATLIGVVEGPIKRFISGTTDALNVLGQFITGTGEIFGDGGGGGGAVNPYAALAQSSQQRANAGMGRITIPFEELPPEMQDILAERNGWGPNQGFVLAAEHAEELWNKLHPPPEARQGLSFLRDLRTVLGDMAKSVGVVLGLATAFKLLSLALVALTSPLGLVVAGSAALGAIFGFMRRNSPAFNDAVTGLVEAFGGLGESFLNIGRTIGGVFGRWVRGEGPGWFTKLGDAAAGAVTAMQDAVLWISEVLDGISALIATGQAGLIDEFVRDKFVEASNAIGSFLGRLFNIDQADIDAAGGGIAGFLRNTFLAPVVNFFTDTLPNAVRSVWGGIGDLWDLIFGNEPGTAEGAAAAGGAFAVMGGGETNGIAAALYRTIVEPVLTFFSETLPNAVRGVWGGIGDLWAMIFGDGDRTIEGAAAAGGAAAVMGATGEGLLRPIVDAFMSLPNQLAEAGWSGVLSDLWSGLVESANNIWDGGDTGGGGLRGAFENLWGLIQDFFADLDWGGAISGAAIAGAIGLALGGLPGLIVGALGGFIAGGGFGLFDPIVNAISGAYETSIKPALDGVWESITGWFATTFTVDNLIEAALTGLSGINRLGEEIGRVIGDPLFVGIVAGGIVGVVAGAATLVGAFTLGLATGIADNAEEWGAIIGGGIEAAVNLIPGLDIDLSDLGVTVGELFSNPATALPIIAAMAAGIAPVILGGIGEGVRRATTQKGGIATRAAVGMLGIAGGLVAEFTRSLTTVVKNQSILAPLFSRIGRPSAVDTAAIDGAAKTATTSLANRMYQAVINPTGGFRNTLRAIGPGIAAIIAGGVAGFATGRALAGESLLEQILGIGGLAAGIGLLSAPAGIAAGALGILGIALGNSARNAQEARDRIAELQQLLEDQAGLDIIGGLDATAAERIIGQDFRDRLRTLGEEDAENWGQSFVDNINFDQLASQALDQVPAENVLVDYLRNLGDEVVAQGELTAEEFNTMLDDFIGIAAEKDVSLENLFRQPSLGGDEFRSTLDGVGVSMDDLLNILGLVQTAFGEVGAAQGNIAWEQSVEGADEAEGSLSTVADTVERLKDLLEGDSTPRQIAEILDTETGGATALSLQAIEDIAKDLEAQLGNTRDAIIEALSVQITPTTLGGLALDFVNQFAGIERELEQIDLGRVEGSISEIEITAANAQVRNSVAEQILGIIQEGLDSGTITTEADAGLLLDQISANVADADLSPAATSLINGVIADMETALAEGDLTTLFTTLTDGLTGEAELERVRTAMQPAGQAAAEGFANPDNVSGGEMLPFINKLLDPAQLATAIDAAGAAAGARYLAAITTAIGNGPSQAELTASVITGAGGQSTTADDGGIGEGIGAAIVEGISGSADDARSAAADVVDGILDQFRSAAQAAGLYGAAAGRGFAGGLGSQGGRAVGNAQFIAGGVRAAFGGLSSAMFNAGANAGNALARGLISQVRVAAAAAATVAIGVITAARNALQISSPSKVFVNIGKEIGQGFIQGIKDSEGDMTDAISEAITNAVDTATERAATRIARAQAAGEIFRLLQPSILPGGTSDAERLQEQLDIFTQVRNVINDLRETAADVFNRNDRSALLQAAQQVVGINIDFAQARSEMRAQFNEARQQRDEINRYNTAVRKLREQLEAGTITQKKYDEKIKELGSRPAALNFEQRQILRTGPNTLDPRTLVGEQNIGVFTEFLERIRGLGNEMIASGDPLNQVISTMQRWTNEVRRQGVASGLSAAELDRLISQYGLSTAALQSFRNQLLSLDTSTLQGAENVANFLEQFVSLREFAQRMIEAGVAPTAVTTQIQQLRDSIINQAVNFGFNRSQLENLARTLGLSNAQLDEFIRQLNGFNNAAANAEAVASEAAKAAAAREKAEREKEEREAREAALEESRSVVNRPTIERLIIQATSGDPEAIALQTWNRFSYVSPFGF